MLPLAGLVEFRTLIKRFFGVEIKIKVESESESSQTGIEIERYLVFDSGYTLRRFDIEHILFNEQRTTMIRFIGIKHNTTCTNVDVEALRKGGKEHTSIWYPTT